MERLAQNNFEAYEKLANAIVLQAVKDYRGASKHILKGKETASSRDTKEQCARFFQSQWFVMLTGIDGDKLMDELDKQIVDELKNPKKKGRGKKKKGVKA